jgi:lipopolysaccharide/colanic/teichoic acid biosynthesis glycosyltransferase
MRWESERDSVFEAALRRALDVALAAAALLALAPLLALLCLVLRVESPGPVLFRQVRHGLRYRPFRMLKFRTLRFGAPDPYAGYEMQADDPRITRVGGFLRRTSLDELPQLLNVLAGDMSLVGPRPLDAWESERCLATHPERFGVKPGLTGLAQVNGRNALSFARRAELDVVYARHRTLLQDLSILLRTPGVMLSGRGLYPAQRASEDTTRWT